MVKKEATIDNAVFIDGLTIIPVVAVSLDHLLFNNFATVYGFKEPVAFIIVSPAGKRAFRITGEEVSIEQLVEECPEIKEMLQRF
ncbi:hypothetical protein MYX76_12375 [Desulfobacterota bacterium AH_259_B03_O07]|nr:hypothetical protein [Desulfobacterota bacterium AH_259_B03_O07]